MAPESLLNVRTRSACKTRMTDAQPACRAGNAPLFEQHIQRHQQIQVEAFEVDHALTTNDFRTVSGDNALYARCISKAVSSSGMSSIASCPQASSSRHQERSPALA